MEKGGADVQERNATTGWVALHEAAFRGHAECIKVCVCVYLCVCCCWCCILGLHICTRHEFGCCELWPISLISCFTFSISVVCIGRPQLPSHSPIPHSPTSNHHHIHHIITHTHTHTCAMLLLNSASMRVWNRVCMQTLLALNAPLRPRTPDEDTPRDLAARYKQKEVVELLGEWYIAHLLYGSRFYCTLV